MQFFITPTEKSVMALLSNIYFYNNEIDVQTILQDNQTSKIDKQRPLKYYRLHLTRRHNQLEPSSIAYCESIEIEMDAPDPPEVYLQTWFLFQENRDIVISTGLDELSGNDSDSNHMIICQGAQCYSIEEILTNDNEVDVKRRVRIFFEAKKVTVVHKKTIVEHYNHL